MTNMMYTISILNVCKKWFNYPNSPLYKYYSSIVIVILVESFHPIQERR